VSDDRPQTVGRPHVAIIGLMGAGKSTVGRRLARELGMAFVDSDELVVAAAGRSIAEIFASEGESAFRSHEFAAAQRAFGGAPSVVALGGGAVTHPPTREVIEHSAVRVYLHMEPRTVVMHLRTARTSRPLVGAKPTLERVKELLGQREALYCEAEITVSGERRSSGQIAREIARLLALYRATGERQRSTLAYERS
jgi:shikimate kinase